jgi:hypothetical protein
MELDGPGEKLLCLLGGSLGLLGHALLDVVHGEGAMPVGWDGRWAMGDGRWAMGDGRWAMGDGRWAMGDGRWEMGDGRWENGRTGDGRTGPSVWVRSNRLAPSQGVGEIRVKIVFQRATSGPEDSGHRLSAMLGARPLPCHK